MNNTAIVNYFSVIETQIKLNNENKKNYWKMLAPEFSSLNFLDLNENKTSEILSFFLDPQAEHAQGDTFLKEFLNKFRIPSKDELELNTKNAKVRCEQPTDKNRRIDIMIRFEKDNLGIGDNFVIGIENKIYEGTADQNGQLTDYDEYLSNESIKNGGDYLLIYIAPEGKEISENSISTEERYKLENQGNFKRLNYETDIIELIHHFSLNCESDRVRSFLQDFEITLKKTYLGESLMSEANLIIDYARKNDENLKTTLAVGKAAERLKDDLKKDFHSQLETIGRELELQYDSSTAAFIPANWNCHDLRFSFEWGGLIYGIFRKEEGLDKEKNETIIGMLPDENWETDSRWLYKFLYKNIKTNDDFYIETHNGKLKNKIKENIRKIIEILKFEDL